MNPVMDNGSYAEECSSSKILLNPKSKSRFFYGADTFKMNLNFLNVRNLFHCEISPNSTQAAVRTDTADANQKEINKESFANRKKKNCKSASAFEKVKKVLRGDNSRSFIASGIQNEEQLRKELMIRNLNNTQMPLNNSNQPGFTSSGGNTPKIGLTSITLIENSSALILPFYDKESLLTLNFETRNDWPFRNKFDSFGKYLCPENVSDEHAILSAPPLTHSKNLNEDLNLSKNHSCSLITLDKEKGKLLQNSKNDEGNYDKCLSSGDGLNRDFHVKDETSGLDCDDSIGESSLEFSDIADSDIVRLAEDLENSPTSPLAKDRDGITSQSNSERNSNKNKKVCDDSFSIDNPISLECINYETGKKESFIIYPMERLQSLKLQNKRSNKKEIIQKMAKISERYCNKPLGIMIGVPRIYFQSQKTDLTKKNAYLKVGNSQHNIINQSFSSIQPKGQTTPQGVFKHEKNLMQTFKGSTKSYSAENVPSNGTAYVKPLKQSLTSDTFLNKSYSRKNDERELVPRVLPCKLPKRNSTHGTIAHQSCSKKNPQTELVPKVFSAKPPKRNSAYDTVVHQTCSKENAQTRLVPRVFLAKPPEKNRSYSVAHRSCSKQNAQTGLVPKVFSAKPSESNLTNDTIEHQSCFKKNTHTGLVPRVFSVKPFSLIFSMKTFPHWDIFSREKGKCVNKSISVQKIISSDFKKYFHFFAKHGDRLKSGSVITKTNNNHWMRKAKIVTDCQTAKIVNDCFSEVAGKKLVLNIYDYTQFLLTFSKTRKQTLSELVKQLKTVDIFEVNERHASNSQQAQS